MKIKSLFKRREGKIPEEVIEKIKKEMDKNGIQSLLIEPVVGVPKITYMKYSKNKQEVYEKTRESTQLGKYSMGLFEKDCVEETELMNLEGERIVDTDRPGYLYDINLLEKKDFHWDFWKKGDQEKAKHEMVEWFKGRELETDINELWLKYLFDKNKTEGLLLTYYKMMKIQKQHQIITFKIVEDGRLREIEKIIAPYRINGSVVVEIRD